MRLLSAVAAFVALVFIAAIIVREVRPGGADLTSMFQALWWAAMAGSVVVAIWLMLGWNSLNITADDKASWLHGAALELIKAMENSGPGGAESRAGKSEATAERFAVAGVARARAGKEGAPMHSAPGPMGFGMPPSEVDLKLTDAALNLAEIYRNDSAKFRRSRGAVRNAALIFVAIVQHGNVLSARTLAIEYMTAQRADAGLPNWANLKLFLDLPPEQAA